MKAEILREGRLRVKMSFRLFGLLVLMWFDLLLHVMVWLCEEIERLGLRRETDLTGLGRLVWVVKLLLGNEL